MKSLEERHQHFLKRATEKYGGKFSYDKFDYRHAKYPSTITCTRHGDFEQTPNRHLNNTYSCPSCHREVRSLQRRGRVTVYKPTLSKEEYLDRLNLPEHVSVDLSDYQGATKGTVTITCSYHGQNTFTPHSLEKSVNKCPDCAGVVRVESNSLSFEEVVRRSSELHENAYIYPDQDYVNTRSKIKIICPSHGEFTQTATKHMSPSIRRGCTRCTYAKNVADGKYLGGYSEDMFKNDPSLAKTPASIYYLQIGDLYKIGISVKGVKGRVKDMKFKSKKTVTLLQSFSCTLEEAFRLEQKILMDFDSKRVYRSWSTELFSVDVIGESSLEDHLIKDKERSDSV